jgi:hypothetical protein
VSGTTGAGMMNEVITMATFLVLGLPTLLGASFLVVFYIALSRESARKRHRSHAPYEMFVAFKLDRPSTATTSPRDPAVSTVNGLRVHRAEQAVKPRRSHAAA